MGDTGTLKTKGGVSLAVTDTKKSDGVYIHFVSVSDGAIAVGDTVTLKIDGDRRDAIPTPGRADRRESVGGKPFDRVRVDAFATPDA